jgi:hypothetical protein
MDLGEQPETERADRDGAEERAHDAGGVRSDDHHDVLCSLGRVP